MSNHQALKRAARAYAKEHGISYTAALRTLRERANDSVTATTTTDGDTVRVALVDGKDRAELLPVLGSMASSSPTSAYPGPDADQDTPEGGTVPGLPDGPVPYPVGPDLSWDQFRLGVGADDQEVVWDTGTSPHMLVAGSAGTGKSELTRIVVAHALRTGRWAVHAADTHGFMPQWLRDLPRVRSLALHVTEMGDQASTLVQLIHDRFARMREAGVAGFRDLPGHEPVVLYVLDEVFAVLTGKDPIGRKHLLRTHLTTIARLGGAAGVHLVLTGQQPTWNGLGRDLVDQMSVRVVTGRPDRHLSLLALNVEGGVDVGRVPGGATYRRGAELAPFHLYHLTEAGAEALARTPWPGP